MYEVKGNDCGYSIYAGLQKRLKWLYVNVIVRKNGIPVMNKSHTAMRFQRKDI